MQMKISEIKINPGRRDTQQRNVEELARSIAAVGLVNPITVTQDNTLIAGLHRLEAAKLLGWTEIECTVSDADGLQAELAEIDENFVRAGLSHRELGDLLLRRKELYEALHPETQQGKRNDQTAKNDNLTLLKTKPFSEDTAENLSDNVVVPIAGMIITFVLCYELISMLMEKNNFNDDVCCKRCISSASNTTYSQLICGIMK